MGKTSNITYQLQSIFSVIGIATILKHPAKPSRPKTGFPPTNTKTLKQIFYFTNTREN
jgi:hypothetical protein